MSIKKVLAVLAVATYSIFGIVLLAIYSEIDTDFDEWMQFYHAKDRILEGVIASLFLYGLITSKGFIKSVFAFGMVLSLCSLIDKLFFEINRYLYTDYIIVVLAILAALSVWKKTNNEI